MNPEEFFGTGQVDQTQGIPAEDFFAEAAPTPAPAPYSGGLKQDIKDFGSEVKSSISNPQNFVTDTLRGLFDPSYKAQTLVGDIAQNTLGSRGVIGTAQLPARAVVSKIIAGSEQHVSESKMQLAETTLHLIRTANRLPEGPQKAQLDQIIADNQGILGLADGQLDELAQSDTTAGEGFGNTLNTGLLAVGGGTPGVSSKLLPRMAEAFGLGVGSNAGVTLSEGETPTLKGAGASGAIAALIPFGGTLLSKLKQKTGGGIQTLGEKIQTSVIRPNAKDEADGFALATLKKYDLGGSLNQTLTKANALMNDLGGRLRSLAAQSQARINLSEVYADAERGLISSSAKNFGQNSRVERVLAEVKDEINRVAPDGAVDVATAQDVKRAAGTMGSWVFNFVDKDATATETVYTKFYQSLREAIEKTDVGPEMKAINKQLQELIPVHNAVVRRIPVAERQNAVSLTDVMGLIGTAIDPKAAPIAILNKASKSGRVGAALAKYGAKIKESAPSITNLGKRIFGR